MGFLGIFIAITTIDCQVGTSQFQPGSRCESLSLDLDCASLLVPHLPFKLFWGDKMMYSVDTSCIPNLLVKYSCSICSQSPYNSNIGLHNNATVYILLNTDFYECNGVRRCKLLTEQIFQKFIKVKSTVYSEHLNKKIEINSLHSIDI